MRRLGQSIAILWGVATLVFFLFHGVGGDPARMMLDQREDPEQLELLRKQYGFDRPLGEQYVRYLAHLLPVQKKETGWTLALPDLQKSYQRPGIPVVDLLAGTFPNTLLLAGASMLFAVLISVPLGVLSALGHGSWWDRAIGLLSTLGMAAPSFLVALVVAWLFAFLWHDWTGLPLTGNFRELDDFGTTVQVHWKHLILPAFTLGIRPLGVLIQMMRSSALDVLAQDYIRTARAKGVKTPALVLRHVLRNAFNPLVTTLSGWFAGLLSGAVFVEAVFGWNGTGKLMVEALNGRDLPVIMGCVLWLSVVFVVLQAVVDVLYGFLDPRANRTFTA
jgi:peptide/nickel transport system permease protein